MQKLKAIIKNYIGNKSFYKMTFALIIPVVMQQVIMSISGYIDNFMINKFSQNAYNGVSGVNRLVFIIFFFAIGVSSGIAIFLSQYLGAKKKDKVAGVIQFGLIISFFFGVLASILIYFISPTFIKLYITGKTSDDVESISHGIAYSKYLSFIGVFIFINFMLSTIFRTLKRPKYSMIASIISVFSNMLLNYILIFGKLGFNPYGAMGAAIATSISKLLEFLILIFFFLFYEKEKYIFHIFKKNFMSSFLFKMYLKKGSPVILNEVIWAIVVSVYAILITRGNLTWYTAYSYSQTICDVFFIFFSGIATGASVLIGNSLGENDFRKAKDYSKKLIGLSIMISVIMSILLILIGPLLLLIFTKVNEIYHLTYKIIIITSLLLPLYSFNACIYFILRAGGDSLRSFLLDEIPSIFIGIPILVIIYNLNYDFHISIITTLLISKIVDVIKVFYSIYFYKKQTWLKNIINADIS